MSEAPVKELYRGRADGVRGDEGGGGFIRLPRATIIRQPHPLLRDDRRARSTAVRVGPPCA